MTKRTRWTYGWHLRFDRVEAGMVATVPGPIKCCEWGLHMSQTLTGVMEHIFRPHASGDMSEPHIRPYLCRVRSNTKAHYGHYDWDKTAHSMREVLWCTRISWENVNQSLFDAVKYAAMTCPKKFCRKILIS